MVTLFANDNKWFRYCPFVNIKKAKMQKCRKWAYRTPARLSVPIASVRHGCSNSLVLTLKMLSLAWLIYFLFHCKHGFKKTLCIWKITTYTQQQHNISHEYALQGAWSWITAVMHYVIVDQLVYGRTDRERLCLTCSHKLPLEHFANDITTVAHLHNCLHHRWIEPRLYFSWLDTVPVFNTCTSTVLPTSSHHSHDSSIPLAL